MCWRGDAHGYALTRCTPETLLGIPESLSERNVLRVHLGLAPERSREDVLRDEVASLRAAIATHRAAVELAEWGETRHDHADHALWNALNARA